MRRLTALVALWMVFAATGVAVGFGAVRLLQDPEATAAGDARAQHQPQGWARTVAPLPSTGTATAHTIPAGTPSRPTTSAQSPGSRGTSAPGPAPSPGPARQTTVTGAPAPIPAPGSGASTLGIDTVAGYVSATCTSGIIRMSASPNPGWEVSELSAPNRLGEVKFEQTRGPEGEIGVAARCEGGRPNFVVDDSELNLPADD
jgi:hypothetical protein